MKLRYISQQRQLIKSFYAGVGKAAVILPSAFLVAVGAGLISLGMVFYMRDVFNAPAGVIGLLAAFWSLSYILGCIFIRPLFERILPRYVILIATFCMFALTLCIHFVNSIAWIFVLYGLFGFANSLFWPPTMAWLFRRIEGAELSKVISKFNFSWSAGLIISPFLAGWLSERAAGLPLYCGSSLFLLTSFMVAGAILVLPGVRKDRETELSTGNEKCKGEDTPVRYPAWVGLYATWVVVAVIGVIFPVYARDDLAMGKSTIGLLLLSRALFMTVGFVVLGRMTFWHFKGMPMLSGQVCLAVLLILIAYVGSPLLLGLVLACMGLLTALSYSNSLFHGVSGSVNRASRMAVHESLLSAGVVIGCSIGGILYQRYSMSTVYWLCSSLVLAGVIVQAGLFLRARKSGAVG